MRRTAARLTGVTALVAVAVVCGAMTAQATQGVPPAVVESLQPGGTAFREAMELNTGIGGPFASTPPAELAEVVSFGHARRSEYLTLAEDGPDHVTVSDYAERGDYWLAVEYRDGVPFSAMEVSSAGELLTLDGWLPEEVVAIDAAPEDAVIATDGRFELAFALTDGGTIAHALNSPTAELIGGPSIAVAELRGLTAAQLRAALEAEPDGVGPWAIGGAPSGGQLWAAPGSPWLWVGCVGLLLVVVGAVALGRRRSTT